MILVNPPALFKDVGSSVVMTVVKDPLAVVLVAGLLALVGDRGHQVIVLPRPVDHVPRRHPGLLRVLHPHRSVGDRLVDHHDEEPLTPTAAPEVRRFEDAERAGVTGQI